MGRVSTAYFSELEFCDDALLQFPAGLPGFDDERQFVLIERPPQKPIVFLQSLRTPGLCFVTVPVQVVDPRYELMVANADLETLGLEENHRPRPGRDVLCLAIVTFHEDGPTANLRAPVVIDLQTRRAVQAIAPGERYSHRHPLAAQGAVTC